MYVNTIYNTVETVTPSDSADFAKFKANNRLSDALYVGGAGVVAVVFADGTVLNFTAVAGEILPFAARRVNSQNTTATLMAALYRL